MCLSSVLRSIRPASRTPSAPPAWGPSGLILDAADVSDAPHSLDALPLVRIPEGDAAALTFGREVGHLDARSRVESFVGVQREGLRAVVTGADANLRRSKVLLPTLLRSAAPSVFCVDPSGLLHEGARVRRSAFGETSVADLSSAPAIDPLDHAWRGGSDDVIDLIVSILVPGLTPDELFLAGGLRSALSRYLGFSGRQGHETSLPGFLAWSRGRPLDSVVPYPAAAREAKPELFAGLDAYDGVRVSGDDVSAVIEAAFGWLDDARPSERIHPFEIVDDLASRSTSLVGACPWAPMGALVAWTVLRAIARHRREPDFDPIDEILVVADLPGEWEHPRFRPLLAQGLASASFASGFSAFTLVASLDDETLIAQLTRAPCYKVAVRAAQPVEWDDHDVEVRAPHGAYARLRALSGALSAVAS